MAAISIAGTVTGKQGEPPVQIREFGNGGKVASFSVIDKEYFYVKQGDERYGQFYRCEVSGKAAEIVEDRLKRGDTVAVRGQLVQREYNDKVYLDVKNASVTFLTYRDDSDQGGGETAF